jgi:hypothetical protein
MMKITETKNSKNLRKKERKKEITLLIMLLSSLTLSSCSLLIPYEQKPACKRGNQTGLCGSITDVYNYYDQGYTIKDAENLIKEKIKKKEKENSSLCDGVLKNSYCSK